MDYFMDQQGKQVQAMLLTPELVKVTAVWSRAIIVEEIDPFSDERFPALNVQCGDEVKRASLGDYVVKKEDGTFDVMSAIDFSQHHV